MCSKRFLHEAYRLYPCKQYDKFGFNLIYVTYQFNEVVTGSSSGTKGRVKNWDLDDLVLKVSDPNGTFFAGENVVGTDSLASYTIHIAIVYN